MKKKRVTTRADKGKGKKLSDFRRFSPIPKHLTPEERKDFEKEQAWLEEERKRREKEGFSKIDGKVKNKKSRKSVAESELHHVYY